MLNQQKLNLYKLNNYHLNIKPGFELEKSNEINLLDVLVKRLSNNIVGAGVYRKPTSTDIYINWNVHSIHAPIEQKIRALTNLIKPTKLICPDESLVDKVMKYLTKIFHEVNNYQMSNIK